MMNKSKISIVIPCYNYGRFLSECIESIRVQTRKAFEIIVMDDCSEDNTMEVAKKFPLVKYIRNECNLGASENMNKGVDLSTGEYVMLLSADDYIENNYLEETAKVLDERNKVGIVYTNVKVFGSLAERVSKISSKYSGINNNGFYYWKYFSSDDQDDLRNELKKKNFMHGSSLFRKKIFENGARYTGVGRGEDYRFWKQAVFAQNWEVVGIPLHLLYYRKCSLNQRGLVGLKI